MDFSTALAALKRGQRLYRKGWTPAGFFVEVQRPNENSKMTQPYLFLNGERANPAGVVPWVPSQADLMADDWQIVT